MPACPRDTQFSPLPPPGFAQDAMSTRRVKIVELLQEIIDNCHRDPLFFERKAKQTDLLVTVAEFVLSPTSNSSEARQNLVSNLVTIGQELLTEDIQQAIAVSLTQDDSSKEILDTSPSDDQRPIEPKDDDDGGFSLDDLANEYLQEEPTPSSASDEKPITSETELSLDDLVKSYSSSPTTPPTDILTALISIPSIVQSPIESILFSNRLSSHDAADDADEIWKETCSPFGQMFCTKSATSSAPARSTIEIKTVKKNQLSSCLLDRSLYERLTRLIELLPKQCIRNSVQQRSIRQNTQQHQQQRWPGPPRGSGDNQRPSYRMYPPVNPRPNQYHDPYMRFPPPGNPRQHPNQNYYNQQANTTTGQFVDRRQQPMPNRHPPPPLMANNNDNPQQRKGPKNTSGEQTKQQKNKPHPNNQSASNNHQPPPQQQQHRGNAKAPSGNKLTREKSGVPGSGPSLNPK